MSEYNGTLESAIEALRTNPGRTAEMRFHCTGLSALMAYFPEHEPIPFILQVHGLPESPDQPGPLVSREQGLTAVELVIRIQVLSLLNDAQAQAEAEAQGGDFLADEVERFLDGL